MLQSGAVLPRNALFGIQTDHAFARAYGVVKEDAKHADSLLEQAVTSSRCLLHVRSGVNAVADRICFQFAHRG